MSARPHTERDPLPPQDWTPTSHAWARRQALQAAAEAVARVRKEIAEAIPPAYSRFIGEQLYAVVMDEAMAA